MDQTHGNLPWHRRRSIRLRGHDYSSVGAYYVTICALDRRHLFGEIADEAMVLNEYGEVVVEGWQWLATHFEGVALDEWIVMPNHMHGILVRHDHDRGPGGAGRGGSGRGGAGRGGAGRGGSGRGGSRAAPTVSRAKPLGGLIGAFKTVTTKRINELRQSPGARVWQRNYWEHIIRDEVEMDNIRFYIADNAANWARDDLNVTR